MRSVLVCCMFISICFLSLPYESFCEEDPQFEECKKDRFCGNHTIRFPFYTDENLSYCGYPGFGLTCLNNKVLLLNISQDQYRITEIFYPNNSFRVTNILSSRSGFCSLDKIRNLSLPSDRRFQLSSFANLTLLSDCEAEPPSRYKVGCDPGKNDADWVLAMKTKDPELIYATAACKTVAGVPIRDYNEDDTDYLKMIRNGFDLEWIATNCSDCTTSGGYCGYKGEPANKFQCFCNDRPHSRSCKTRKPIEEPTEKHTEKKTRLAVLLGTAVPGAFIIVILGVIFIFWRRKQLKHRKVERDSSADIEDGTSYFGVPVFSYKELEEATHNFDPAKELGDGGFGTVYYGKLRDGRDVAVKRCYENNYRRVEQFMNEIHILTLLRHRNLVILYGSTSHRSRDLLLVYEYISNGTLADHIHGDKSTTEPLIWPIRMNIAIEIASALSYLHKSDIVHRDVKTNNILLDNNFCVKVADFGLSRLFPTDVTHVSTAPQGTPGYVDPEYHQCYQLTDKSDVYSFGVVLVELISSLPAVDINRQRNEINLANLAIDRIQKSAFHELIDPSLGQEASTAMMTTSVAELAFRCLQLDKDLRPTMDEVLECLEQIQGVRLPKSTLPPPSPEMEDAVLLKKNIKLMDSPVSVTDKWISTSTTPSTKKPIEEPIEKHTKKKTGLAVLLGTGVAVISIIFLVLLFFICYRRMKNRRISYSYPKDVEAFIKKHGSAIPKRFRYSTLKTITNSFKEELGKGGYGNVYKGMLSDGCVVAVKVLNATKGNGEEFMNEVASIGSTSHVNIVSLLGFVYEGKRRALIYEYMPNGSLEKFIHGTTPSLNGKYLGWEKLYSIALGISRGLEYLHCGCNTQILHFDIKPHNILLDEDFCPKISDFGLAKLYTRNESVLSSIMQARGTIGYIAPEVISRNFGPVSHKSDVYSYGMMILEMVGGRKNVNAYPRQ